MFFFFSAFVFIPQKHGFYKQTRIKPFIHNVEKMAKHTLKTLWCEKCLKCTVGLGGFPKSLYNISNKNLFTTTTSLVGKLMLQSWYVEKVFNIMHEKIKR